MMDGASRGVTCGTGFPKLNWSPISNVLAALSPDDRFDAVKAVEDIYAIVTTNVSLTNPYSLYISDGVSRNWLVQFTLTKDVFTAEKITKAPKNAPCGALKGSFAQLDQQGNIQSIGQYDECGNAPAGTITDSFELVLDNSPNDFSVILDEILKDHNNQAAYIAKFSSEYSDTANSPSLRFIQSNLFDFYQNYIFYVTKIDFASKCHFGNAIPSYEELFASTHEMNVTGNLNFEIDVTVPINKRQSDATNAVGDMFTCRLQSNDAPFHYRTLLTKPVHSEISIQASIASSDLVFGFCEYELEMNDAQNVDRDYFQFHLSAGNKYTISVEITGTVNDPALSLLGVSENWINNPPSLCRVIDNDWHSVSIQFDKFDVQHDYVITLTDSDTGNETGNFRFANSTFPSTSRIDAMGAEASGTEIEFEICRVIDHLKETVYFSTLANVTIPSLHDEDCAKFFFSTNQEAITVDVLVCFDDDYLEIDEANETLEIRLKRSTVSEDDDITVCFADTNNDDRDSSKPADPDIYISTRSCFDSAAELFNVNDTEIYYAGKAYTDKAEPNLKAGTYYLYAATDYGNCSFESDEANTAVSTSLVIEPWVDGSNGEVDLEVFDIQLNERAISEGEEDTVRFAVANDGDRDSSGPSYQAVYISKSSTFDGTPKLVYTATASTIHKVQVGTNEYDLLNLTGDEAGNWYIHVKGDYNKSTTEKDRGNDVAFTKPVIDNGASGSATIEMNEDPLLEINQSLLIKSFDELPSVKFDFEDEREIFAAYGPTEPKVEVGVLASDLGWSTTFEMHGHSAEDRGSLLGLSSPNFQHMASAYIDLRGELFLGQHRKIAVDYGSDLEKLEDEVPDCLPWASHGAFSENAVRMPIAYKKNYSYISSDENVIAHNVISKMKGYTPTDAWTGH